MSELTLIWSFRNRIPELITSMETAHTTCEHDVNFCLIDANSEWYNVKLLRKLTNKLQDPNMNMFDESIRDIRICESSYRSSLTQAWNLGMMLSPTRYVAFASSDVEFKNPGWADLLLAMLKSGSKYVLIENHAVFGFDKAAIPEMGWFDEKFKAGRHFDCDYMIRASEAGIPVEVANNNGFYTHGEDSETLEERTTKEIKDRLPMNDKYNERHFKSKWQSSWPGWDGASTPHPPTRISQVKRLLPEIDPHPLYTERFKDGNFTSWA